MAEYRVISTSRRSADVADIELAPTDPTPTRRRILRPEIVDNARDAQKTVKVTLMHQRRHPGSSDWLDADSFNLATLTGGQEVRLALDSSETFALYEALRDLYAIGAEGVPRGSQSLAVIEAAEHQRLTQLATDMLSKFRQHGDALLEILRDVDADTLAELRAGIVHHERLKASREFRAHFERGDWTEADWQTFFEENEWIFGHNLVYQFLKPVQDQPAYGGLTVTGRGIQRGDFLMATEAAARFTVLVEIKRPDSALLHPTPYRNNAYRASDELSGGVGQLQANCRMWVREGSEQERNRERLAAEHIFTCEPRGILVIGNTAELDQAAKRTSFEMFRRNLHNPEIVTYDELLAKAEYLVTPPIPVVC